MVLCNYCEKKGGWASGEVVEVVERERTEECEKKERSN